MNEVQGNLLMLEHMLRELRGLKPTENFFWVVVCGAWDEMVKVHYRIHELEQLGWRGAKAEQLERAADAIVVLAEKWNEILGTGLKRLMDGSPAVQMPYEHTPLGRAMRKARLA